MGAAASLPDELDAKAAEEACGASLWNNAVFNALAKEGKITKAQFIRVVENTEECDLDGVHPWEAACGKGIASAFDCDGKVSCGDRYVASSALENRFTHVLNITQKCPNFHEKSGIQYLRVSVDDVDDADLLSRFRETSQFIDEAVRQPNGKVLVHCQSGMSRSGSVCIAYLMAKQGMSLVAAYDQLRNKRPGIIPNYGFFKQLQRFEAVCTGSCDGNEGGGGGCSTNTWNNRNSAAGATMADSDYFTERLVHPYRAGFTRDSATRALEQCNGDFEQALEALSEERNAHEQSEAIAKLAAFLQQHCSIGKEEPAKPSRRKSSAPRHNCPLPRERGKSSAVCGTTAAALAHELHASCYDSEEKLLGAVCEDGDDPGGKLEEFKATLAEDRFSMLKEEERGQLVGRLQLLCVANGRRKPEHQLRRLQN